MNLPTDALDPEVAQLVAGYPCVVTTLVAWGDMDANRHVNNVVYLRYMEHARLHYFGMIGWLDHGTGIGPILAYTDCRFRRPLAYPDDVSIATKISEVGEDRFTMQTIIVSHKLKAIAAEGQQRLVSYDYLHHHKAPLPEAIRQRIAEIENRAGPQPNSQ